MLDFIKVKTRQKKNKTNKHQMQYSYLGLSVDMQLVKAIK